MNRAKKLTCMNRCTQVYSLSLSESAHTTPMSFWIKIFTTAQVYFSHSTYSRDKQTDTELFFSSDRSSCSYDAPLLVRSGMFLKFQPFQCHSVTTVILNCYDLISTTEATNKLWNAKTQCINYHMMQIAHVPRPSCFIPILLFVP